MEEGNAWEQPQVIDWDDIATLVWVTLLVMLVVTAAAYCWDMGTRACGIRPLSFVPGVPKHSQPLKVRALLFLGSNKSIAGTAILLAEIFLGSGACARWFSLHRNGRHMQSGLPPRSCHGRVCLSDLQH